MSEPFRYNSNNTLSGFIYTTISELNIFCVRIKLRLEARSTLNLNNPLSFQASGCYYKA